MNNAPGIPNIFILTAGKLSYTPRAMIPHLKWPARRVYIGTPSARLRGFFGLLCPVQACSARLASPFLFLGPLVLRRRLRVQVIGSSLVTGMLTVV